MPKGKIEPRLETKKDNFKKLIEDCVKSCINEYGDVNEAKKKLEVGASETWLFGEPEKFESSGQIIWLRGLRSYFEGIAAAAKELLEARAPERDAKRSALVAKIAALSESADDAKSKETAGTGSNGNGKLLQEKMQLPDAMTNIKHDGTNVLSEEEIRTLFPNEGTAKKLVEEILQERIVSGKDRKFHREGEKGSEYKKEKLWRQDTLTEIFNKFRDEITKPDEGSGDGYSDLFERSLHNYCKIYGINEGDSYGVDSDNSEKTVKRLLKERIQKSKESKFWKIEGLTEEYLLQIYITLRVFTNKDKLIKALKKIDGSIGRTRLFHRSMTIGKSEPRKAFKACIEALEGKIEEKK